MVEVHFLNALIFLKNLKSSDYLNKICTQALINAKDTYLSHTINAIYYHLSRQWYARNKNQMKDPINHKTLIDKILVLKRMYNF